jgi:hypothetical protein
MSAIGAATAPARTRRAPAPVPAPRVPGARLTVVPAQSTPAGRMPFAVLVGAILLTGLMGLLLVHTLAAQESFRVHDLTQRLAVLQDEQQQIAVANQQASTPTALRIEAEDLGMRPSTISDYKTAKDGRVIGTLTAVPVAAHRDPVEAGREGPPPRGRREGRDREVHDEAHDVHHRHEDHHGNQGPDHVDRAQGSPPRRSHRRVSPLDAAGHGRLGPCPCLRRHGHPARVPPVAAVVGVDHRPAVPRPAPPGGCPTPGAGSRPC